MAALILLALAAPAVLACTYLLLLTLLSAAPRRAREPASHHRRFDVVVPAHDEAAGIARTVASLRALDWPAGHFRVLVVADNCTDATAALARRAGAEVLERTDAQLRGKGYALAHAFEQSARDGLADAVVVVDADSRASPNLLRAFAWRLERGAHAVQAHYGVLNPHDSWRTRLIAIAQAAFHIVRSRARQRLRVSCGIRGNGWCVTHKLLRRVPYRSFSLTEDVEYGIQLGLAGYRVHYADEAHVDGEMVSGERTARAQRQRWESGRFGLIRASTLPLLRAALHRRSGVCLDLALDLLVLPLSYVALNVAALLLAAGLLAWWQPAALAFVWVGLACAAAIAAYVLRGWQLSGVGARGLLDLAAAPWFIAWKTALMLRSRAPALWVRTGRERP
ncbi:MAG TPA: glycosyltransferase family 2 protein [Solimonas sp.]|nr:glycosyltransferase family 2 protein [Solimonas sp.]